MATEGSLRIDAVKALLLGIPSALIHSWDQSEEGISSAVAARTIRSAIEAGTPASVSSLVSGAIPCRMEAARAVIAVSNRF